MPKILIKNSEIEKIQAELETTLEKQKELYQELRNEMDSFCDDFVDSTSDTLDVFVVDISKKKSWLLEEFKQLSIYMNEAVSILNEEDETIAKTIVGSRS